MLTQTALKILVEEMHSAAVATIGDDGKPHIRIIDMMLYDESGVYFLTAKGKAFYSQLKAQKFIALTAVKDKKSVSLRGEVKSCGNEKLDEIFERNPYMQAIYPKDTRNALEVFALYKAQGEYFDISRPEKVVRESFSIGGTQKTEAYVAGCDCIGCKKCFSVCPQKCIDTSRKPVLIDQSHCLHCGSCAKVCPKNNIKLQSIVI